MLADGTTRWVWVNDVATYDLDRVHDALDKAPYAHIAIGNVARGIEGFRRSHQEALTTQRMLPRLGSSQRIARFNDIELVALLAQDLDGADNFIKHTLGQFEEASSTLHTTVLTFINELCNASRTAKILHIHRNTLLHRLEAAERFLPRPLEHNAVHVAVALEALQWRGNQMSEFAPTVPDW